MDAATPLIHAEDLHTYYGVSHILHGVNFTVGRGETVCLMGRNGMGKSTTLRTVLGLVRSRRGTVTVRGQDVTKADPSKIARLGVAYVPEGRGIFAGLSVREHMIMAERRGPEGRRDWTIDRVLDAFPRLQERINQQGTNLSGGEQQMLSIGRALLTNPDVLILDEATEGLAPLVRKEIWRVIRQIKETGIATVIVDKNVKVLLDLADRNVILVKGQIVYDGPSKPLQDDPTILRQHIGL